MYKHFQNNNGTYTKQIKSHIQNVQNKFIVTYVDISLNNYAIICKYFYAQLLN